MATDLGSDEFETRELPPRLLVDDVLDLWIDFGQRGEEHLVLRIKALMNWERETGANDVQTLE